MDTSEHDLSGLSDDEFNTLFEEARKQCKSDDLHEVLSEICRLMNERQRLALNN